MFTMKRWTLVVLCSMLCLALAACSSLGSRQQPGLRPPANRTIARMASSTAMQSGPTSLDCGAGSTSVCVMDYLKPPAAPVPGVPPDSSSSHSESQQPRVTWVGHATLLVQVDGVNLLTDPHWGHRASPVSFAGPKRHQPPGIPFAEIAAHPCGRDLA
jgi:hypothetical protein